MKQQNVLKKKNKSQPKETIGKRVKLIPRKRTIQKESDDKTKSVIYQCQQ